MAAHALLISMAAFTMVAATSVLTVDPAPPEVDVGAWAGLPPGHPPVDGEQLPAWHPPVDDEDGPQAWLPPGHPPVGPSRLPPGHPPVRSSPRMEMPIFPQDGLTHL